MTVWQYDSMTDWQCDCNRVIDRSTARAAVLSCIDAAGGAPRWVMNMSTCSPSPGQSSLSTSCLESSLSSSSSSSSSWALLPSHHAAGKEKTKKTLNWYFLFFQPYLEILDYKIWHYLWSVSKKQLMMRSNDKDSWNHSTITLILFPNFWGSYNLANGLQPQ